MATESFLRVGIDGTAAQDGARVVTRSMDDIKASAGGVVASVDAIKTALSSIAALAIIQLATELMKLGAQATVTQAAFENMAKAQGANANEMLEAMKKATAGTVDDIALMHEGMKGLAADLSPEIIEGLAGAARTAAQMTGSTVQEAMDRIVDGIATGMPRALKQMMVISKDQMNELTKAQAFMDPGDFQKNMASMVINNDVIHSYELLQTGVTNAQEAQQKFKAAWEDTKATIGVVVEHLFPIFIGALQAVYSMVLGVVGAFVRLGESIMNALSYLPGLSKLSTGNLMGDTLKQMQTDSWNKGMQNMGLMDKDPVAPKYTADDAANAKAANEKLAADLKNAAQAAAIHKAEADEIKALMAQDKQRYDQTKSALDLNSKLEDDYYKNISDLSKRAASDEKAMVDMQKASLEEMYKNGLLNEQEYFNAKFGYMQTDIDTVKANTAAAIQMDNDYYAQRTKNLTDEYNLSQSYVTKAIADTQRQYEAERQSAASKIGQLGAEGVYAEVMKLNQQEQTAVEALYTQLSKSTTDYYKNKVDLDTKAMNSELDNMTALRNAQIKSYQDALTLAQSYQDKANQIAQQVQGNKDKLSNLFAPATSPTDQFYTAYKAVMAAASNDSSNATDPAKTQAAMDQLFAFMTKYKDFKADMGGNNDFEMGHAKAAFQELNSKLEDISNNAQSMSNQLLHFASTMKDAIAQSNAGIVSLEGEMRNLSNQIIGMPPLDLNTSPFMMKIAQAQAAVASLGAGMQGGTNYKGSAPPGYDPVTGNLVDMSFSTGYGSMTGSGGGRSSASVGTGSSAWTTVGGGYTPGGSGGDVSTIWDEEGNSYSGNMPDLYGGFARGTNSVPKTGPYILHQGEKVIPAGQGGGISIGDIHIHGISDPDALAKAIVKPVQKELTRLKGLQGGN